MLNSGPVTTESNSNSVSQSLPDSVSTQRFESKEAQNDDVLQEDNDDEDDEEEEDGDGDDDVEGEGDEEAAAATTAEQLIQRKKLADGFFEVQSIRKKRIFKGEPQYLIKWRGWPESANTWEPVDHLQTCPDVIEAYEASLQSGQKKSSRKRKLKFTQQKKYSYGATKSKISPIKSSLSNERQDSSAIVSFNHSHPQPNMVDVVVEHDEAMKRCRSSKKGDCNSSMNLSPSFASSEKDRFKSIEDGPGNELSRPTIVETGQSNQRRGAKRRKSGSVRRFTQTESSLNIDCFGTPLPVNGGTSERVGQLMLESSEAYHKKKSDSSPDGSAITKIIKPISYSASVTNNVQDVAVTFVVMRSDGKEVMVDNKFLKATNPLLLINFYEEHLRYNPA